MRPRVAAQIYEILLVACSALATICLAATASKDGTACLSSNKVCGIDVSLYQGNNIDWSEIKQSNYVFVFIRATIGLTPDDNFVANINGASAQRLLTGTYHYAKPAVNNDGTTNAVSTAEEFIRVAKNYLTEGYLRPVLDVELLNGFNDKDLSKWTQDWMDTVQIETDSHVQPLLYVNLEFAKHLTSLSNKYDLWIADPYLGCPDDKPPRTGKWQQWVFFQYCQHGSIPAIQKHDVDLDVFNGDLSLLRNCFEIHPLNITLPQTPPIPQNCSLVQSQNGTDTFWLQNGKAYRIDNPAILKGMATELGWNKTPLKVTDETLNNITQRGVLRIASPCLSLSSLSSSFVIVEPHGSNDLYETFFGCAIKIGQYDPNTTAYDPKDIIEVSQEFFDTIDLSTALNKLALQVSSISVSTSSREIKWAAKKKDVEGFSIYRAVQTPVLTAISAQQVRATADTGSYTLIGTTESGKERSFTDSGNLQPGRIYCYKILPLKQSNDFFTAILLGLIQPTCVAIPDAGPDQTVAIGSIVQLNGQPNDPSIEYTWKLKKPRGSKATLSAKNIPNPTFVADIAGQYILTLGTKLGKQKATDEVVITAQTGGPPSPVVSWLIYESSGDIYRSELDGTNVVNLSNSPGTDFLASPSPDGRKIVFVSRRDCGELVPPNLSGQPLYIMDKDGTNQQRLQPIDCQAPYFDWFPSFTADSSKIIFSRKGTLHLINVDGTGLTDLGIQAMSGKLTPDSSKIVYSQCVGTGLFISNSDGTNAHSLTPGSIFNTCEFDISPDGKTVVFGGSDGAPNQPFFGIFTIGIDGSNVKRLAGGDQPSFSPDGRQIAFTGFIMNSDGSNLVPLAVYRPKFLRKLISGVASQIYLASGTDVDKTEQVQLRIFNLTGRLVLSADRVNNGFAWRGQDMQGKPVANGVYLAVITTRREDGTILKSAIKKIVILR